MGLCHGKELYEPPTKDEIQRNKEINIIIKKEKQQIKKESANTNKILLLGPADAGKSTIMKQFRYIYSDGIGEEERKTYKRPIIWNTIESMNNMIEAVNRYDYKYEQEKSVEYSQLISKDIYNVLNSDTDNPEIPTDFIKAIEFLWKKEPAIKKVFERKNEYNLIDSAEYFLNDVERILAKDYVPTQDDLLFCRNMTTKILEIKIVITRMIYKIYDVGGHKNLRNQWADYFDDVTALIFVVSLSSYDQNMVENPEMNQINDALSLFQTIIQLPQFTDTSLMLFLSKTDLFKKKIKVSPIENYFPDYTGGTDYSKAITYFGSKFIALNKNKDKQIYTHLTWATDTKSMKVVFAVVTETVRRGNLKSAGLF
ncbi:trimeric G-protein alpha o subunit [Neocallimastix lanati (nom. inval.)]|jgi:signal recognition particle receptor subunit beta|uniref:Trimeric G-protein alpha o subunit n=1 Tax=Neocallimastix californiae TaxID=1754190 RepID=A0A1Y2BZW5_9FUNG|nr:trimeric G-protein alpha o subunit [Neocallimastix sp. JGI-2020a]ORY40308.1 trimeric G-protein alpha o subunit [Neocallimastix californiae]|eukprot:ORY40308.1 trimeric G-protein alpha o subunit [Neocallimastix californiae]